MAEVSEVTVEVLQKLQDGDLIQCGTLMKGLTGEQLDWVVTRRTDKVVSFDVFWFGVAVGKASCAFSTGKLVWRIT